ncbi:MAG: 2-C-methyl-D-erythritol 4-phosphate cytidylyltransferase [Thermodesulfobacterium sp.]|jgi:2-C-methyl-D-erythritol 4-phosphate cytidylyltransferase|nr:2-C-methyl-D-erythritol 4-phosphate cytidylyltransferase [Thermodesulfobacterium sp.]
MITAILACGGRGERFGGDLPKQFLPLAGLPIYLHSLFLFEKHLKIDKIVIVCPKDYVERVEGEVKEHTLTKVFSIVHGGETRQESVSNGVKASPFDTRYFLVHDAVRPCLTQSLLDRVIERMLEKGAVIPVIPCSDALVRVEEEKVVTPVDRTSLYLVQTPQGIKAEYLRACLKRAEKEGKVFPDEGSLLHFYGYEVFTVPGEITNLKVTYPQDFELAEILIKSKMKGIIL